MTCPIDWCAFSWDAFATLAAGVSAVVGAVYIGHRQLKISEGQSEIAERQTKLIEQQANTARVTLRRELFDRRYKVYEAVKASLRDAMAVRIDFEPTPKIWNELINQLEQAKFLFPESIRSRLLSMTDDSDTLLAAREQLRDLRRDGDARSASVQADVNELRQKMRKNLASLSEEMGEEMQLYVV